HVATAATDPCRRRLCDINILSYCEEGDAVGVLDGVRVVDLSWGIAGPLSTMLMADHGAQVTMVERPGGAPFVEPAGAGTWRRGKRSAVLDLTAEADRRALWDQLAGADVLVESFSPATAAKLGLDPAAVAAAFPRLVHC